MPPWFQRIPFFFVSKTMLENNANTCSTFEAGDFFFPLQNMKFNMLGGRSSVYFYNSYLSMLEVRYQFIVSLFVQTEDTVKYCSVLRIIQFTISYH